MRKNRAWVSKVALTSFVAAGYLCGAPGSAEATANDVEHTIRTGLAAADIQGLMAQFNGSNDAVARTLAAMAADRVLWQLDHSSATAQTCVSALKATRPDIALFCARFDAGNMRLRGKFADAARSDQAAAAMFKTQSDADPTFQSFLSDYAAYTAMPDISVERKGNATVPLQFDSHALTMDVLTNGHKANVGLDTGAHTTFGRDSAERLGIRILVTNHGTTGGLFGDTVSKSLGVIDRLSIDTVTLTNVPVDVVTGGRDVIGNDVLMHLGQVRISKDSMTIPMSPDALAGCQEHMLVSSSPFGGAPLLVKPLDIDGATRTVLLDTGDSFVMSGTARAASMVKNNGMRSVRVAGLTSASRSVKAIQSSAQVTYGGKTRNVEFSVFPEANLPYDFILGAGALAGTSLDVDFDHAHVCLSALP